MALFQIGSNGKVRLTSKGKHLLGSSQSVEGFNILGMNTSHQTYYAAMVPWIDLMKVASDWVNNNTFDDAEPIVQDENGWVLSMGVGQQLLSNVLNTYNTNVPDWNTSGNYLIVYYTGDGSNLGTDWAVGGTGVGASASVISHDTVAKRVVYSITHSDLAGNYLRVVLNAVNAADPIRDIKLIPEIYEAAYLAGDRFHPVYLAEKAPFKAIRFMNWSHMNGSLEDTWSERRTMSHRNYSGGSWANSASYAKHEAVPYEEQIALANLLQVDIQVNVPHLAQSDWWTGLANLLYSSLDPNLKIYVERSNECWNFLFQQTQDDYDAGQLMYSGEPNAYYRGNYYSAHQARLMHQDFEAVFSGSMDRLIRVFAWQKDTIGRSEAIVEWEGLEDHIDHWQIAPYFAGEYNNNVLNLLGKDPQATVSAGPAHPDITLNLTSDQIIDSCLISIATDMDHVTELRDLMAAKGIGLSFYECGQHLVANTTPLQNNSALTAVFTAVNIHPRMEEAYLAYWRWALTVLGTTGCAFHYADYYVPDKYGSWGMQEYQGQPIEDAPKLRGTLASIAENA